VSPRNKNTNGAGSVFKRKDGKWVAQVWDPMQRKKVQKYATTKKQAQALLDEMKRRIDQAVPATDVRSTLTDYVRDWLHERAGRRRTGNTVRSYAYRLATYVLPRLGHLHVGAVKIADIERLFDQLVADGLSHSSIKGVKNALAAMYTDGLRDRVLAHNPAAQAQLPLQGTRTRQKPPPTQAVTDLLREIESAPEGKGKETGRILQVLMFTGARIGEVLAARWSDMDLDGGMWLVRGTSSYDAQGNQIVSDSTKTGKDRTVRLAPILVEILQAQRRAVAARHLQATIWGDYDFVFPNARGGLLDPRNVRHAVDRHYPDWGMGFHVLRRWFISTGLADPSVGAVQVSRLVGHAKTSTTTDIYGSLLDEGSTRIIEAVERSLGTKQRITGA
jgi:integrase